MENTRHMTNLLLLFPGLWFAWHVLTTARDILDRFSTLEFLR